MATRTINLEIALGGESAFNDEMRKVTANLSGLKSEMALCSAEFKGNEKSQAALAEKSRILTAQVSQQRERVKALTEMYEKQKKELGEDAAATDKYRKDLNNAKAVLAQMERAQADTNDELKKASSLYGKAKQWLDNLSPAAKKAASAILAVGKGALSASAHLAKWTASAASAIAAATGTALAAGIKTLSEWGTAAIESAKAAEEAGEPLSNAQRQWLDYSETLDKLKPRAESAKAAMSTLLLPALNLLSKEGGALLSGFDAELNAAAGDPARMGRVISKYITQAAKLIADKLPEIMQLAEEFLTALGAGFEGDKEQILASVESIINTLVSAIADHADDIADIAVTLITSLGGALIDSAPELLAAGLELIIKLAEGLLLGLPKFLTETVPELIKQTKDKLVELGPELAAAGHEIGQALFGGVIERVNAAKQWLAETISNIAAAISNFFRYGTGGIEARQNVIPDPYYDGYATGLPYVPYDNFPALLHKGEMVLTAAQSAQYRAASGSAVGDGVQGGKPASGVNIQNINIQSVPQTPAETAAAIRSALEQARWI